MNSIKVYQSIYGHDIILMNILKYTRPPTDVMLLIALMFGYQQHRIDQAGACSDDGSAPN